MPEGVGVGIDHPALQLTVSRKAHEMQLRSYFPTSGARSLAKEAAVRRFLTVKCTAGSFSLLLSFVGTKESSLTKSREVAIPLLASASAGFS